MLSLSPLKAKGLCTDIAILQEMLHNGEIFIIEWINSKHDLVNPLTKVDASSEMKNWRFGQSLDFDS